MEDAQSATGFGGQLGNAAFPGKIMADSETQKHEIDYGNRMTLEEKHEVDREMLYNLSLTQNTTLREKVDGFIVKKMRSDRKEELHFQLGLQSQSPTGNPPSCKVLPWPT